MEIVPSTTIAITFTAGELFALQQALTSAGLSAQDEARAHWDVAVLAETRGGGEAVSQKHRAASGEADQRAELYLELASRVGHRAGELPEDVPAGFGTFPRRGDGGLL